MRFVLVSHTHWDRELRNLLEGRRVAEALGPASRMGWSSNSQIC